MQGVAAVRVRIGGRVGAHGYVIEAGMLKLNGILELGAVDIQAGVDIAIGQRLHGRRRRITGVICHRLPLVVGCTAAAR